MKRSNIIASLLFLLSLTGFYAAPAAALCVTPGEAGHGQMWMLILVALFGLTCVFSVRIRF